VSILSVVGFSCGDFDFPPPSLGFVEWLEEAFITSSSWRLSSGKDLAHLGDIVFQEVFVQGMSDLQPADERERGDFFTTIGDLD